MSSAYHVSLIEYTLTIEVDLGLEDRETAALRRAQQEVLDAEIDILHTENIGYAIAQEDIYIRDWYVDLNSEDIVVELIAARRRIEQ